MDQVFKPGDNVPKSGIYKVIHDTIHKEEHEITAVIGEHFPPCKHCGLHPRFVLIRAAHHITTHKNFKA